MQMCLTKGELSPMFEPTNSERALEVFRQVLIEDFKAQEDAVKNLGMEESLFLDKYGFSAREMIYLLLLLERRLGARIAPQDLESFYTVGDIVHAIENTLNSVCHPAYT